MKKLLCLMLTLTLLFSFAACGGTDSDVQTGTDGTDATVKFNAENYTVLVTVDESTKYITFKDKVTVTPADTKLVYSSSDEEIASLFTPSTGEFEGVKSGEVTITAKTEDGKASDTCKLTVVCMGAVVARKDGVGGVINKYFNAVEEPDDTEARILIINKNLPEGTDMSDAVSLNYGEVADDKSAATAYANMGYFVAKTGETAIGYSINRVPEGEYIGLIVSSRDYTMYKTYSKDESVAKFKATAIAKYFTDAEIESLVENFWNREFYVGELTVKTAETTVFGHKFTPDSEQ